MRSAIIPINPGLVKDILRGLLKAALTLSGVGIIIQYSMGLSSFAFMDILQDGLDDIRKMWNSHLIRKSRYSGGVTGIPNELFYLPGIQGYLS